MSNVAYGRRNRREAALGVGTELGTSSVYDSFLRGVAAEDSDFELYQLETEIGNEGKFVLKQELGSGGMGRVYRALDRYLLRDVAIKFVFRPAGMSQDDFMAVFWQEAHVIARLDQHDNIVRILDVDRSGYPPFIVMEYLDGQSLEGMLRQGPVDLRTALHVMLGATSGLREAHAKGVFHRDLKPSNIFVQKTGRVKLLDFGLARLHHALAETAAAEVGVRSIPPMTVVGTPAYMAPEQWRGEEFDTATDLWAVGAILYRLLANSAPFAADSVPALSARVLSGEHPPLLASTCPDIPEPLTQLVDRLLRFERSERPQDVAEVVSTLESVLLQSSPPGPAPTSSWPNPQVRAAEFWSRSRVNDCVIHENHPGAAARHWHRALLVVVPDGSSDAVAAWQDLAASLLAEAGVDIDIALYAPSQPRDMSESAGQLRRLVEGYFKRLRHIFFVVHGGGAELVLRMLRDEARQLRGDGCAEIDADGGSLFYRTRYVVILSSGSAIATMPCGAEHEVAQGIAEVADELASEARRFARASLPAPALCYVGVGGDPGSVSAELAALRPGSPLVKSCARLLGRPETMLASESIAQTFELHRAGKIASLVASAEGSRIDHLATTAPGSHAATQAEVFEELLVIARSQQPWPVSVVVTGGTGVGKSTVLRMLARRLSEDCIAYPDRDTALPVLVSLELVRLPADRLARLRAADSDTARGRALHDMLLAWWCEWTDSASSPGAVTFDWITGQLRSSPVTLMFDGLDDLLANHPTLEVSDLRHMVAFFRSEYRQNRRLAIMYGVRSAQPWGASLASGSGYFFEILALTAGQAMRKFPAASTWIQQAVDAQLEDLLFTPLVLAHLSRRPVRRSSPSGPAEIVLFALITIIEHSDLCGKVDDDGEPVELQRWIDALTAIAWCLFRRMRGGAVPDLLRRDVAAAQRSWQRHLDDTQQRALGARLVSGIRLPCDGRVGHLVLYGTILYPTAHGEVRFVHRGWQEYLAARYLAQAVLYRHVDELGQICVTAKMCRAAGELLDQAGVCIDEALVKLVLDHAREPGAHLVIANFSVLLGNSRILIEGPAIDVLLSSIPAMPPVVRCIALNELGYRALRGDDASAQELRLRLVHVFEDCLAADPALDDVGVMRSIAWCYLSAFAHRYASPRPRGEWPGLPVEVEPVVLAMMCSTDDSRPRIFDEHRSIQLAFLDLQQAALGDPCRLVSIVHDLYCLAVARRHGGGIAELSRDLPALLSERAPLALAIEDDPAVPELRMVLELCHRLDLR